MSPVEVVEEACEPLALCEGDELVELLEVEPEDGGALLEVELPEDGAALLAVELPEDGAALLEVELPEDGAALLEVELPDEGAALLEVELPEDGAALLEVELPEDGAALLEAELPEDGAALLEAELPEDGAALLEAEPEDLEGAELLELEDLEPVLGRELVDLEPVELDLRLDELLRLLEAVLERVAEPELRALPPELGRVRVRDFEPELELEPERRLLDFLRAGLEGREAGRAGGEGALG